MDDRESFQPTHAHPPSAGLREELIIRLMRAIPDDGKVEPLPGLRLHRASAPTGLVHGVSYPSLCIIAQGSKDILLGTARYRYDPAQYLIATVELPVAGQIIDATPERPYLNLRLLLDPILVGSVMVETGQPASRSPAAVRALDVSPLDADLFEAVVRLVRLLDDPADARFLAPLITREIIYRLLKGDQRARLQQIAVMGSATHRIAAAVERIRAAFDQPLRIEEVAHELGMSVSGFHHHFKAVTAMSPLQFQKHLRLQEARRLMLGEYLDATSAGARVGYDNAAHFTREYKRLFGAPPIRDVSQLRDAATAGARI